MRHRIGDRVIDTDTLQLLAGDREVDLEPQAFAVLCHLLEHRDRVVSKEELLDSVWGSRFVSESALTTRIKQVRRALGDNGRDQALVRTFHGRGYRLVAPVEAEPPATVPSPARTRTTVPQTRYADGRGASIAFQTFGEGPDLVLITGFGTNVEAQWEHPLMAGFLRRLGEMARVTVLDKRGVGLSDRMAHGSAPSLETRADDLHAVLDAAGIRRSAVLGSSEGGSLAAVYAAADPDRVDRLVLHNTWVTGPSFPLSGPSDLDYLQRHWGDGRVYARLGPSLDAVPGGRELLARYERQSATPRTARHMLELIGRIDIAGVLPAISVPTLVLHRADDPVVPLSHGRELAESIPGARLRVLAGAHHNLFSGDADETLAEIRAFLGEDPGDTDLDERVLATVLFVDVVDSRVLAREPGDRDGIALLDRFHAQARTEVERHRGRVVDTTGDGVLATFDGPGRAVTAAVALRAAVRRIDVEVRAGLHTAEVQRRGSDIAGIGVHIAGRVAALAPPGEVWVSRTVTDLVAGTGLAFEPRGEHALEGLDEPWQLFAAVR